MPSFCELCGNSIQSPKNVIIDGSIFNVCLSCSKRGKPYEPNQPSKKYFLKKMDPYLYLKKNQQLRSIPRQFQLLMKKY
jgi:ribosome-binding protein aMBF1 (putative translation factor)